MPRRTCGDIMNNIGDIMKYIWVYLDRHWGYDKHWRYHEGH